jgi:uncharacterized C2H2 Zn-finger protein
MKKHKYVHHSEEKELPCPVCLFVFKRQDLLDSHMKTVHGEKEVMCPTCGKLFSTVKNMKNHLKSCGEKIYNCSECDKVFSSRGARSDHVRKVHKGILFTCGCGKAYASRKSLFEHGSKCEMAKLSLRKRLIDPTKPPPQKKKYPCKQCDKVFNSTGARSIHVNDVHKGMIYQCTCGRTYTSYSSYQHHLRRDCSKEYKCDQCHMTFLTMKERFHHKQAMHNSTVYHCDCGKPYWRLSTLNVHKQSGKCTARQAFM